jgi:hypothetical protein
MKPAVLALAFSACVLAQEIKFPASFDGLAKKAKETVNVSLDKSMLSAAVQFLGAKDGDEARVLRAIEGLRGIYVRSFEFEKPGEYAPADLDSLRDQLKAPVWKRIVDIHSRADGEAVEIYVRGEAGKLEGMFVLAAEPKELTVVHLDGPVSLSDLGSLGGQFGIPKAAAQAAKGTKPGQAPAAKE